MKTKFPIKEGTLEIFDDCIEIRDKWKSARFIFYVFFITSVLLPLELVFNHRMDDEWLFGVVLLSLWFLFILFKILNPKKRIFQGQLTIDQIDLVVLERYNYDKLSAKFILKDGKRRLVDLDFDRFWKADLEEVLAARGISVESV